jgi:hypothetical protein
LSLPSPLPLAWGRTQPAGQNTKQMCERFAAPM